MMNETNSSKSVLFNITTSILNIQAS
jgi:hypothetical protein